MNPAALKANLASCRKGATIIVNTDEFTKRNLQKVGYDGNPLEDDSLAGYDVHPVGLTSMTLRALEITRSARRTPNARRTCSPSGSCPGSTRGPTSRR
jgi:hypothetical protein